MVLRLAPARGSAYAAPVQIASAPGILSVATARLTNGAWLAAWKQHHPDQPRPAVDFSKEMIVGVFMGSRPNAGFSTTILSATAANGALIVRYSEKVPAPGGISAQVLTFPFHLVAIPKAAVTDVKFEKADK